MGIVHNTAFVGTLVGSAILAIGIATAQESGDQDQLRMLGQCRGCIFEDLDVSDQRMTGVDLTEASFRMNSRLAHELHGSGLFVQTAFNFGQCDESVRSTGTRKGF